MALDRSILVTAALRLLDEVGLDGLTLRRLAAELDVQAPAIYWHFKNKQELIDQMATAVFTAGLHSMPFKSRMRWDKWAMEYGRSLRRMLLLHRDGARMVSGTRVTDNSFYAPMERCLSIFTGAGFSANQAVLAASTIYSYAIGFVIEEQAVTLQPGQPDDFYDPDKRAERVDAGRFPLAAQAGKYLFANFDRRFDDGLKLIVAGLGEQKLLRPKRAGS